MSTSTRLGARSAGFVAAAALCAVSLGACGSGSSTTATSPDSTAMSEMTGSPGTSPGSADPGMRSMIMIQDFSFTTPASVKAGSTVEVMNMDGEAHTVTADSGGAFDVTVPPGRTAEFTAPSKPGSYPYHCTYHSNMHGTLRVR